MINKNTFLLCSFLAAGLIAPVFASSNNASTKTAVMPGAVFASLDELLQKSRVSIGASREGVVNEMRLPNIVLSTDVWVYTNFRATNVANSQQFDSLLVTFKDNKVINMTLTHEAQVLLVLARMAGASEVAQR